MIQILLGVLVLLVALVILMGAGDTLRLPTGDIFPLIGYGGTGAIVGLGALLIARGVYGRKLKAAMGDKRAATRSAAAATAATLAILLLALTVPLTATALNVLSLGGFPVGYYMASLGAPVAMIIFVFLYVLKEDAIETERLAGEDGDPGAGGSSD